MDPVTAVQTYRTAKAVGSRVRRWAPVLAPLALVGGIATMVVVTAPASVVAPVVLGLLASDTGGSTGGGVTCEPVTGGGSSSSQGEEVARLAYGAGWRGGDLAIAVAVAKAESGWRAGAVGGPNSNGTYDHGLWQINDIHAALLASGDPYDGAYNASMAYQIWSAAGGWTPWATYNSGSYVQWMDEAQAAVAGGDIAGGCTPGGGAVVGGLTDPGDGPQGPDRLRPRAANGKAIAKARWGCDVRTRPCVSSIGGYAYRTIAGTSKLSDHATGRANDIMIPSYHSPASRALGTEIADFYVANADALGVKYVIYYDRIWQSHNGWKAYSHSAGSSDTYAHRDHVHVSYLGG